MSKVILASSSLGRKKLLSYLKIPFAIIPSEIHEEKIIGKDPLDTLVLRARAKAESVCKKICSSANYQLQTTNYIIVSADSGAIIDNQLIGKPKNHPEAQNILTLLSGRTHDFITAVNIIKIHNNITKNILETTDKSRVTFRKITSEEINCYLSITDYTRFAASYALTSAQDFITGIEGSLSNVIGLPLEIVIPQLKNLFLKY